MKNKSVCFLLALLPLMSHADENILTGDVALACEATLCLSSGTRPGECAPSLSRYFNINEKHWSDTVKARRNFLELCPASEEEGMPDLVKAISEGAGRCDAGHLNKTLYETKKVMECRGSGKDESCHPITYYRINNVLPKYCGSYINHEWTDLNSSLSYQGSSEWIKENSVSGWNNQGGKWVD